MITSIWRLLFAGISLSTCFQVNNAGILIRDTVETLNADIFERTMNVNLRAAVWMTHFAVPALIQSKGSIVNVSSVCGNRSVRSGTVVLLSISCALLSPVRFLRFSW